MWDTLSIASGRKSVDRSTNSNEDWEGSSNSDGSFHEDGSDNISVAPAVAKKETSWVRWSKKIVFLVLFITAGLCGGAVYYSALNTENRQFEAEFQERATQLAEAVKDKSTNTFDSVKNMQVSITSFAITTKAPWPYVQIPHYNRRVENFNKLTKSNYAWLASVVKPEERKIWEQWSVNNSQWILEEAAAMRGNKNDTSGLEITPYIHRLDRNFPFSSWVSYEDNVPPESFYAPIFHASPLILQAINWNTLDIDKLPEAFEAMTTGRGPMYTQILNLNSIGLVGTEAWPQSHFIAPIFESFDDDSKLVAVFGATFNWHHQLEEIIPENTEPVVVILENSCGQAVTFRLNGPKVDSYLGEGDLHDDSFDRYEVTSSLGKNSNYCPFSLRVYPTKEFRDSFQTSNPIIYCAGVILIFLITSAVFFVYDCFVQKRQNTVMHSVERSNAIVSSLFPAQVRDRLMDENDENASRSTKINNLLPSSPIGSSGPAGLEREKAALLNSKPIADLFPNTTVLFADLANFTAWSSVREPSQVFMLLEQIYGSFDQIAKRRGIFKVETIGDCYVAVTGLPKQREDHAEAMAKFCHECRARLHDVVRHLEVILGPDTADLTMRFGMHSGPVTAGVLRGEKSRFQLFGDTVNTASRIETTGENDRIHLSQDTANILIARGVGRWVKEREGEIVAKGKGAMKTYWLEIEDGRRENSSSLDSTVHSKAESVASVGGYKGQQPVGCPMASRQQNQRTMRLVEWNVDILYRQLQKVVSMSRNVASKSGKTLALTNRQPGMTILDEVREIIELPNKTNEYRQDPADIDMGKKVKDQLRNYVSMIASMYHENPFHSFEHASHVTQSVSKLLARVVTPDSIDYTDMCYKREQGEEQMHQYTYGITSDPLTHFACIFSALIHDVDHCGLPNATLVKEGSEIARLYRNKSVAEQNSVDLAWNLLMEPIYEDLRACIFRTQDELERFRQLVVNSVMATDIVDKELGALRKKRWETAFATNNSEERAPESQLNDINRKATIVIEHIIQASDVSHTMQHWHVYIKWNEKLFAEMYKAYTCGRADKDPAEGWYQGELGFFDYYLIPLGKKLKECGVFGVASDEYLNYAIANRKEWEQKGRDIVKGYIEKHADK